MNRMTWIALALLSAGGGTLWLLWGILFWKIVLSFAALCAFSVGVFYLILNESDQNARNK